LFQWNIKKDQLIAHSSGAVQSSVAQSHWRYTTVGMVSFDIQEVWKYDATLHVNSVKHMPIFQFFNSNDNLPFCTVCAENV